MGSNFIPLPAVLEVIGGGVGDFRNAVGREL